MALHRVGWLILAAVIVTLGLAACGGGQPSPTPQPTPNPLAVPLPPSEAQNYLGIKSSDGATPCGVFTVSGHGRKRVDLTAYPACKSADYTVLCLNDKAQWIGDYVSEVKVNAAQHTLGFTSAQDGICAVFPKP